MGRAVSDRVGMNLAFASDALKVILGTKIDSLKKHFNGPFFVLIKLTREAALWSFPLRPLLTSVWHVHQGRAGSKAAVDKAN